MAKQYTDEMKRFITDNINEKPSVLCLMFNEKFGTDKTVKQIYYHIYTSRNEDARSVKHRYLFKGGEIEWLKNNIDMKWGDITKEFNKEFGSNYGEAGIKGICKRYDIKKPMTRNGKSHLRGKKYIEYFTSEQVVFVKSLEDKNIEDIQRMFSEKYKVNATEEQIILYINSLYSPSEQYVEKTKGEYIRDDGLWQYRVTRKDKRVLIYARTLEELRRKRIGILKEQGVYLIKNPNSTIIDKKTAPNELKEFIDFFKEKLPDVYKALCKDYLLDKENIRGGCE